MTTTPIIDALDFNTPFDLAMALGSRAVAVPCVVRIGNELWTIQDYETGNRIAQGIMLAIAPGWEKNTTIRTR